MLADKEAEREAERIAQEKAEKEARLKAEQEAQLKAEKEAKLKAEQEAKMKAEEEAKRKSEKKAKQKATKDAEKPHSPEAAEDYSHGAQSTVAKPILKKSEPKAKSKINLSEYRKRAKMAPNQTPENKTCDQASLEKCHGRFFFLYLEIFGNEVLATLHWMF